MTGRWVIYKEFPFSASHQLRGLPEEHQCARMHGHNYILAIRISSNKLFTPGFVIDYGELTFVKYWADHLDHRHLNDRFEFNPTSERIVEFLHAVFSREVEELVQKKVQAFKNSLNDETKFSYKQYEYNDLDVRVEVGLSETPKTWAWYTEDN